LTDEADGRVDERGHPPDPNEQSDRQRGAERMRRARGT
jgi:hypothetical protein